MDWAGVCESRCCRGRGRSESEKGAEADATRDFCVMVKRVVRDFGLQTTELRVRMRYDKG
jgi:hypothetical protein